MGTTTARHSAGTPTGGQFAATGHHEADVDLTESADASASGLDAALQAYNATLMTEGMRVGPPSPRWREDHAAFEAAQDAVADAFAACAPDDVDAQFEQAIEAAAAERITELASTRDRLAEALVTAGRAKSAAEAVDILEQASGRGFSLKRPTRREATERVETEVSRLNARLRLVRADLDTSDVVAALDAPLRARCEPLPSAVVRHWIDRARSQSAPAGGAW